MLDRIYLLFYPLMRLMNQANPLSEIGRAVINVLANGCDKQILESKDFRIQSILRTFAPEKEIQNKLRIKISVICIPRKVICLAHISDNCRNFAAETAKMLTLGK